MAQTHRHKEATVDFMTRYWNNLSPAEKTLVVLGGTLAVVATGGAVAYAVAGADAVLVAAGPVILATGKAAEELAKRV